MPPICTVSAIWALPSILKSEAVTAPSILAFPLINIPDPVMLFVITSPSGCKWNWLYDISIFPPEPDIDWPVLPK